MKKIFIIIVFLISGISYCQNIFEEVFDNCDTSRFALESEEVSIRKEHSDIIDVVSSGLSEMVKNEIRGVVKLKVIVGLDGKSCLLSLENNSNIKLDLEKLKGTINENLIWEIPNERVSPIILINFKKRKIIIKRLGLNGNIGWHTLEE